MPCPTPSEICPGRPRSTESVGPRNDHNEMGVIPRDNSLLRNSHLPSNRRVAMKQLEAFQEYRQALALLRDAKPAEDRKSTRLNSSHRCTSYAVFCLKKKQYKSCPHAPRLAS